MSNRQKWWIWELVFWGCCMTVAALAPNLPTWKYLVMGCCLGLCYGVGRKQPK